MQPEPQADRQQRRQGVLRDDRHARVGAEVAGAVVAGYRAAAGG